MKPEFSRQILKKILKHPNFNEIRSVWTYLGHADRRTDRHDEAISRFSQLCELMALRTQHRHSMIKWPVQHPRYSGTSLCSARFDCRNMSQRKAEFMVLCAVHMSCHSNRTPTTQNPTSCAFLSVLWIQTVRCSKCIEISRKIVAVLCDLWPNPSSMLLVISIWTSWCPASSFR